MLAYDAPVMAGDPAGYQQLYWGGANMLRRGNVSLALLAVAALVLGMVPLTRAQDQKSDVTGTWKWSQEGPGGQIEFTLKLKQDGEKVTGTITGFNGEESAIEDGKVKDGTISFKVTRDFGGRPFVTTYTGKLSGGTLKGKSETVFTQEFEAKRNP
jgi:hypothetical protein